MGSTRTTAARLDAPRLGVLQFLPRRNRASRVPVFYRPPFDRARLRGSQALLRDEACRLHLQNGFVPTAFSYNYMIILLVTVFQTVIFGFFPCLEMKENDEQGMLGDCSCCLPREKGEPKVEVPSKSDDCLPIVPDATITFRDCRGHAAPAAPPRDLVAWDSAGSR